MRRLNVLSVFFLIASLMPAADKYTGPLPPKSDVPYILHADNLLETEVGEAKEEQRKDTTIAVIAGPSSPVKTPLAEPVFILKSDKLLPDKMEAYKLEVKGGNREVVIGAKKAKSVQRSIYLSINKLGDRLYKIEVDEPLENGEYSLTPQGSNSTFSFAIY